GTLVSPALTVNSGTLTVSSTGQLGASTALNNNDTATFNQAVQSMAGVSGSGTLALNGTALTLTSGSSGYSGTISGSGSILVNGATANVTLSGNNTFTGGASSTSGVLKAGSVTAFGTNPNLTISGSGTLDVGGVALGGGIYNVSVGGTGV